MARERGFVVEVTAFLPAGETDVAAMSEAALRLEQVTQILHGLGFSAVAVSSKFTSRKVEADPMPDLDDSKFPTASGAPRDPAANQAILSGLPPGNGTDPSYQGHQRAAMEGILTADEEKDLDIPPNLQHRKLAQP